MEASTGEGAVRRERVESLGWLTESSIMPKKQRVIEGVSASSIVQLKAELYETQEDIRRREEGDSSVPKHRGRKKNDVFARKNSGVEGRESRDKLIMKDERNGNASYAALLKKAEIYDKLVKGELPDEEEREKYSVDFLRKGFLEDEKLEMERERRGEQPQQDEEEQKQEDGEASEATNFTWSRPLLNETHKQLVKEVNKETIEAREKATVLKQRRQNLAEKHREKLKQAFLKKQLEKLKASGSAQIQSEAPQQQQAEAKL